RDVVVGALLDRGEHLLDEERVSLSGLLDSGSRRFAELEGIEAALDQDVRLHVAEWFEMHACRCRSASPARPCVEKLRPREAEDEERDIARPIRDVLDQIEQRRLGPVSILEEEDEWAVARDPFEQLSHRPEGVLAC